MHFQPKSEQEIAESKLWKTGVYDFEVLDAFEKTSKAGNPMIELKLRLSDGVRTRIIWDYLLEETPEKLRHACAVCGLLDKYETGVLSNDDFVGKTGKLRLIVEKGKGRYADKNAIADYLDKATSLPRSAIERLAHPNR